MFKNLVKDYFAVKETFEQRSEENDGTSQNKSRKRTF